VTLAFLIFKARVTEQYSIYLVALGVMDVALWNPQRKRLLTATVVTALFYLILNNYFLVRFLSPIYTNYQEFEIALSQIEPIRVTLLLVSGIVFTWLNIRYLINILKSERLSPTGARK
jgi:multisubunit Na+/H+ antiporter MnhB subunit